jgi:3-methyladenine DNA glycosylase Tag
LEQQHWKMPDWWLRDTRPANDDVYFENMCRVIFQAGLNWHVIDNKWTSMREAFADFKINQVACYTSTDAQNLLKNPKIIRNKGKIQAVIFNAIGFKIIQEHFGSFQKYLDSMDKSDNYVKVVKNLTDKFKWLGLPSAALFLYTVGEKIEVWE